MNLEIHGVPRRMEVMERVRAKYGFNEDDCRIGLGRTILIARPGITDESLFVARKIGEIVDELRKDE